MLTRAYATTFTACSFNKCRVRVDAMYWAIFVVFYLMSSWRTNFSRFIDRSCNVNFSFHHIHLYIKFKRHIHDSYQNRKIIMSDRKNYILREYMVYVLGSNGIIYFFYSQGSSIIRSVSSSQLTTWEAIDNIRTTKIVAMQLKLWKLTAIFWQK